MTVHNWMESEESLGNVHILGIFGQKIFGNTGVSYRETTVASGLTHKHTEIMLSVSLNQLFCSFLVPPYWCICRSQTHKFVSFQNLTLPRSSYKFGGMLVWLGTIIRKNFPVKIGGNLHWSKMMESYIWKSCFTRYDRTTQDACELSYLALPFSPGMHHSDSAAIFSQEQKYNFI